MTLRSIEITGFRGIPQTLAIGTSSTSTPPVSIVLFGDNGTGKSSIVDAVEFGLQARLQRQTRPAEILRRSWSLAAGTDPAVRVELADGTKVTRTVTAGGVTPPEPLPNYAVAPVALRRDDVVRFWSTPESQRQTVFIEFFRRPSGGRWVPLPEEERAALETERLRLKRERRDQLGAMLEDVDIRRDSVPLDSLTSFDAFVTKTFQASFGRNWPRSGPQSHENPAAFVAAVSVRRLTGTILGIQRQLRAIDNPSTGAELLADVLQSASEQLTVSFSSISESDFVKKIEIEAGSETDVSLKVRLSLSNNRSVAPEAILSESNLDLLALLLFTAIAKAASFQGQGKVLVLDDVVQSVDAPLRGALFEFLLDDLAEWQFLITTHDRLWREQLIDLFRAVGKPVEGFEISSWSFETGPVLRGALGPKRDQLNRAIEEDDAIAICSRAGMLLEEFLQNASWRFGIAIIRKKGDRYTLGDLWGPVRTRLREIGLEEATDAVSRRVRLRNLVGAHYVEWAQTFADAEARQFALAVLALMDSVVCRQCGGWIKRRAGVWVCGCGVTSVP
jgi:Protein of unknown function (DUF2813)